MKKKLIVAVILLASFCNAYSMTTEEAKVWHMVKRFSEDAAPFALYGEQQDTIFVDTETQEIHIKGTIMVPPGGLANAMADSIKKKFFPENLTLEECKKLCRAANRGQMRAMAEDILGINTPWISDDELAAWRKIMRIVGREKYPAKQ